MESQMTSSWLSRSNTHCCLVLLLLLSVSSPSLAQPEDKRDEVIQQLKAIATRTQDYDLAVRKWEYNSKLIIGFVVAIGSMGIAVSILQGFGTPLCKIACVMMGGLVGTLTLVNVTLFPADHRAYGYSALKARSVLNELRILVSDDPKAMTDLILQARVDKGLKLIKRMEELEDSIYKSWATPPKVGALLPYAYAESVPDSQKRGVFIGVGESTSLSEARATALTLAIGQAAEVLASTWSQRTGDRVDPYAVRPFIEKVIDIVDEDVTEERNTIRTRVTIRVPTEFFRDYWSTSFGKFTRPELLRSGDHVLLGIIRSVHSSQRVSPPRMPSLLSIPYVGIELGQLRSVTPQRAVSVQIVGVVDGMEIEDGSPVRIIVGTRDLLVEEQGYVFLGPEGSAIAGRVGDGVVFRLRRADEPSVVGRRSVGPALRDGDAVELSIGGRVFTVSDNRVLLREGSGTALTITRVTRRYSGLSR